VNLDAWGIITFWVGAVALSAIVFQRAQGKCGRKPDYIVLFAGIGGMIAGIALLFLPDPE
jgi:hypothetical protein